MKERWLRSFPGKLLVIEPTSSGNKLACVADSGIKKKTICTKRMSNDDTMRADFVCDLTVTGLGNSQGEIIYLTAEN